MTLEIIKLEDAASGATAKILPGFGFNCYELLLPRGERRADVLWSVDGFDTGNQRASGSGIPILFPFPGRIRGGVFRFEGSEYKLPSDDGRGNAIHGFVLNRPWQVVEATGQRVVGRFHASQIDKNLLDLWPADFRLTVAYELNGTTLDMQVTVDNPDGRPLPVGFGIHPYFRLPLRPGATVDSCQITVPAASYWELVNLLPTGHRFPVDERRRLLDSPIDQVTLDDVLGDLEFDAGQCTGRLVDAATGDRVEIAFGEDFRACVVYTPPHREAICIEPYTSVPDPFTLEEQGVESGLRILARGESFSTRIAIRAM